MIITTQFSFYIRISFTEKKKKTSYLQVIVSTCTELYVHEESTNMSNMDKSLKKKKKHLFPFTNASCLQKAVSQGKRINSHS